MRRFRSRWAAFAALGAAVAGIATNAQAVTTVGTFTGGDAGEGLDLDGTFLYAVNARGSTGVANDGVALANQILPVRDAVFTTDAFTPGVSIVSNHSITNWHAPNYGATANDDNLETVMQSIRWAEAPSEVVVTATGLTPGATYKLQLLFADNFAGRNFDVVVENNFVFDNLTPGLLQAPILSAEGVVLTETFVATDNTLNVRLTPSSSFGTTGTGSDNNAILQGFTLEVILPEPATFSLLALGSAAFAMRRRRET